MRIWVDADGCPEPIKEIVIRAALRVQSPVSFVANRAVRFAPDPLLTMVVVSRGPDVADAYIVDNVGPGDVVVTSDVPLSALVVPKGAVVINAKGEVLDQKNIGEKSAMRDLLHGLRSTGQITGGGPGTFDNKMRQQFANALDRHLARHDRA